MSIERIPPVMSVYASEDFMVSAIEQNSMNITAYPPDVMAIVYIARSGDALLHPLGGLALFAPAEAQPGAELDPNIAVYQYADGRHGRSSPWGAVQNTYNNDERLLVALGAPANEQEIARQLFSAATTLPGEVQATAGEAGSIADYMLASIAGIDMRQFKITKRQTEVYGATDALKPVDLHIPKAT